MAEIKKDISCKAYLHSQVTSKMKMKHYYRLTYSDNMTTTFSCVYNYHLQSGNLTWKCVNGSWFGTEPHCAVDSAMEKYRLSAIIAGCSFLIPLFILMMDFCKFIRSRRTRRAVFVKHTIPREQTRIRGHVATMNITLQDVINVPNPILNNYGSGVDLLTYPPQPCPKNKSADANFKPWYEPASAYNKPDNGATTGNFMMFGAGRHFAAIGKRFLDG